MNAANQDLRQLAGQRWRMALILSAIIVVIYFGFILLVGFDKQLAATQIVPGVSVGIVLGALVIVVTWLTTWFYVSWANRTIDGETHRLAGRPQP